MKQKRRERKNKAIIVGATGFGKSYKAMERD